MKVLDLFSGFGTWMDPFRDAGHEVVSVDLNPRFKPTICADVKKLAYPSLDLKGPFDGVIASPPCEMFSIARNFHHGHPPDKQRDALGVVASTFRLIAQIQPNWFVVENPRGKLRKFIGPPKETIYLCSYGSNWMKPTDLWGKYPGKLRMPCAPHHSSPRGKSI